MSKWERIVLRAVVIADIILSLAALGALVYALAKVFERGIL